ncbi:MAG: hypothetical protein COA79_16005 [Planctomycetota bacterium]|nr:MAG: hypothetical protein COA79_16005 [Planctomycetota bacterium]
MNLIKKHFQRYREKTPWEFCQKITLEKTILSLVISFLLANLGVAERENNMRLGEIIFLGIFLFPIIETIFFQTVPIWVGRYCKANFTTLIIISTIIFTIAHAFQGIAAGITAGLVGGFYLAFSYVHWSEISHWTAIWVTTLSHSIHNAIIISLAILFGQL